MKKEFILPALVLSLAIHFITLSTVSLYTNKKKTPVIYSWLDMLGKRDLFLKDKDVFLPKELDLSFESLKKDYFLSFLTSREEVYSLSEEKRNYPPVYSRNYSKEITEYLYLWNRWPVIFPLEREEKVTYKVFVSKQGKIIFSFPMRLPMDSHQNVYYQEYVREAAFFLNDKSNRFFWTNMEGVIK